MAHLKIGGKQMYLWRTVNGEGEVLDIFLQAGRNTEAETMFFRASLNDIK